ncbi:fructose permease [Limosilactobacillus kribbianus]|uniref:fructose permease n=1 Tax=Limosilactobacillus kribbianus TaxID=2982695 RepID=UPI002263BC7C|nr:fructose permease [Limosilactobacillus kribbianus]
MENSIPAEGQIGKRTISLTASWAFFGFSIVINSMGNVLTLVTSSHIHPQFLGSAYWTAAENNLGLAVLGDNSMTLFWAFMVLGMLTSVLNAILMHKWDWKRIGGNFIFMLPFSVFIQWFSNIFNKIMPDAYGLPMIILYVLVNFLGVALIGTAISIYQRANLVLHPADDLFQIIRFRYCHGNATVAMWLSYIPPTIMAIIAAVMQGGLYNFGLGTLFALAFQGAITGWADKHIFPKLTHQALDVGN